MLIQIIIALGLIVFLILYLIERRNKKELLLMNNKKKIIDYYYHKIKEIESLRRNDVEKIEKIRILSKKLFNDYYNLDLNESFGKMASFFEEKHLSELKEFSEIMLDYYYKKEEINKKTIERLITILKKEIRNISIEEVNISKVEKKMSKKNVNKETQLLLEEIKDYLNKNKIKEAEKSYERLEGVIGNKKSYVIKRKMNKIYDRIIKGYYLKRKSLRKWK